MFVIEVPYFNLDQIYNSGQAPRWIVLNQSPEKSKYVIPYKDKVLKIEQQRNRFDWEKHRFLMSCSEEEFYDIWFNYFDLSTDYLYDNAKVRNLGGKFKVPANRGNGIHILNQDIFEMHVYCALISKIGFGKAHELMNKIAQIYGIEHTQKMREAGKITWYEWPTPILMLEKLNEEKESSNNVKKLLKKICNELVDNGEITEFDNDLFKLFGMHDVSVFPLVGIENALIKNFGENPEEFADWYLSDIKNKGLVYLYILYHITNKPKEVKSYGVN